VREDFLHPDSSKETKIQLEFSLKVPGLQTPVQTKGMEGNPEKEIREIDLLIFDKQSGKDGITYYYTERKSITDFEQNDSEVTFKVKDLDNRENEVLIMVIANAKSIIDQLTDWFPTTETKKYALDCLLYELEDKKQWNTSNNYTPIPMYGEVNMTGISPAITIQEISLTRMVARIDIINEAENFTLNKVSLVNYYSKSKLSPPYDADGTIIWDKETPEVNSTGSLVSGWDDRNEYEYQSGGLLGEIYVFETQAEESFLILEGKIAGDETLYYYRLDYMAKESTDPSKVKYLPVKRNHRYLFTIEKVTGIGYETVTEAIEDLSFASSIESNLLVYDHSKLSHIAYNGKYMLGVAEDEVIYEYAYEHVFTIPTYTDYPEGWKAEVVEGTDWLFLTRWDNSIPGWETPYRSYDAGKAFDHEWEQLSIIPNPITSGQRTGKIRLTAGLLSLDVTVTQKKVEATSTLGIQLLDENGEELAYTYIPNHEGVNQKVYTQNFNLGVNDNLFAKRIYAQSTDANGHIRVVGEKVEWISGINGTTTKLISYANPATTLYPLEIWRQGGSEEWDKAPTYQDSLHPFDIEPLPGEEHTEYIDEYFFTGYSALSWDVYSTVKLKLHQSDWLIIVDFTERYYLGCVEYSVQIKSSTEWEIVDIYETDKSGNTITDRLLTDKSSAGYLTIGATGGGGATIQDPVSTELKLTTNQWNKGVEGRVHVVFRPTKNADMTNRSFSFEVFEHHQDYITGSNSDPLFYTFPINLPRTDDWPRGMTSWTNANAVCQAMGEGWRLPTFTEAYLITAYLPAFANTEEDMDPYAKLDANYTNGWYYNHFWTMASKNSNTTYETVSPSSGYTSNYTPDRTMDDYNGALLARCVYDLGKLSGTGSQSQYYPYIDNTSDITNGPIIVSSDGSKGVKPAGLNNVAPKFQIALTDMNPSDTEVYDNTEAIAKCKQKGSEWRLPTHEEMLLIFALGGSVFHNDTDLPDGFDKLSTGIRPSGYAPLSLAYNYWTSSSAPDNAGIWTIRFNWGEWLPLSSSTKGDYILYSEDGTPYTILIGGVRCVRTVSP